MSIKIHLEKIRHQISEACSKSGRAETSVNILAVSKMQSLETLMEACGAGLNTFGENYVQEALEKQKQFSEKKLHWHFIGHLQTNKVKSIAGKFDYIHSVDRVSLADKLNSAHQEIQKKQKIFIEVNLAGEKSKSGVRPDQLFDLFFHVVQLEALQTCGLMIMPPMTKKAEDSRPYFVQGRELLEKLNLLIDQEKLSAPKLTELSMGTSQDYLVAIEEGATWIRLGSVLLGERKAL
ncbi:MAG: YggS family pyridoxal phosphate-dependent enzyme [Bdellovibrionales bacterium]|nr:YggS family pyridoxal phosphate-dependent enzyme [Bdellovibrionales bacterium]